MLREHAKGLVEELVDVKEELVDAKEEVTRLETDLENVSNWLLPCVFPPCELT